MNNEVNNPNAEISLSQITGALKTYAGRVNNTFFNVIEFVKRNMLVLLLLLIGGGAMGTYLDSVTKAYAHKVIVMPNFDSVNYLYEEIERLNTKIKENDIQYLEQIGIKNPEDLQKIEIEAIVDIYEFIDSDKSTESNAKFQLFKLISENGDMEKMLLDETTSKNYKNHLITIVTKGKSKRQNVIDPLLSHFEDNAFFKARKKVYFENLDRIGRSNDSIMQQIDAVIKDFSAVSQKTGNGLTFYNQNTEINSLLNIKQDLIETRAAYNVERIIRNKVFKESSTLLNIKEPSGKFKIILPFLLLLIFVLTISFRKYYKREKNKRDNLANA